MSLIFLWYAVQDESLGEKAKQVAGEAKETLSHAADLARETATAVGNYASGAAKSAKKEFQETGRDIKDNSEVLASDVSQGAQELKEQAQGFVQDRYALGML